MRKGSSSRAAAGVPVIWLGLSFARPITKASGRLRPMAVWFRSMFLAVPLRHDSVLMAQRDTAARKLARRGVIGGIADAAARGHRQHLLDRELGLVPDLDLVGQILALGG